MPKCCNSKSISTLKVELLEARGGLDVGEEGFVVTPALLRNGEGEIVNNAFLT